MEKAIFVQNKYSNLRNIVYYPRNFRRSYQNYISSITTLLCLYIYINILKLLIHTLVNFTKPPFISTYDYL